MAHLGINPLQANVPVEIFDSQSVVQSTNESQLGTPNAGGPITTQDSMALEKPKNFTNEDIIGYAKLADIKSFVAKTIKLINSFDSAKLVEPIVSSFLRIYGYPDFKAFDSNYGLTCFFCGESKEIVIMAKLNNDISSIKDFIKTNELKIKIVDKWLIFTPLENIISQVNDITPFIKIATATEKNDLELTFKSVDYYINYLLNNMLSISFKVTDLMKADKIQSCTQLVTALQNIALKYTDGFDTISLLFGITDTSVTLAASAAFNQGTPMAKLCDSKNSGGNISNWANFIEHEAISQISKINAEAYLDMLLDLLKSLGTCDLFDFFKDTNQLSKIINIVKSNTDGTYCEIINPYNLLNESIKILYNETNEDTAIDSVISRQKSKSIIDTFCFSWTGSMADLLAVYDYICRGAQQISKRLASFSQNNGVVEPFSTEMIELSSTIDIHDGVTIYEYIITSSSQPVKVDATKALSQINGEISGGNSNSVVDQGSKLSEIYNVAAQGSNSSKIYKEYIALVDGVAITSNTKDHIKELITAIKGKKISQKALTAYIGTLNPGDVTTTKIDIRSIMENIIGYIDDLIIAPNYNLMSPLEFRTTTKDREIMISCILDRKTIIEIVNTIKSAIILNEIKKKAKKAKTNTAKKLKKLKPGKELKTDKKKKIKPDTKQIPLPQFEAALNVQIFNEKKEQNSDEKIIIPIKTPLMYKTHAELLG
ncbi:MAG: hypothetical protein LBI37_01340 [Puniceicoccales bacterium]|jgi:hypothetical protein|nr:hypothetical protein [Puniceicoccales bacterium]